MLEEADIDTRLIQLFPLPVSDIEHLVRFLRSQPALQSFAASAKYRLRRTHSVRDKPPFRSDGTEGRFMSDKYATAARQQTVKVVRYLAKVANQSLCIR